MIRPPFALAVLLALAAGPLPSPAQTPVAARLAAGVAAVEFLDVGQGDAVLIRSPEGKAALVDAGPSRDVVRLLRARGVEALDLVVVSHHHLDHYGGMDDVIREFRPRVFLASDGGQATPTYLRLLELVRDRELTAIAPTGRPRRIGLGSVTLTVLPRPPEDPAEEYNNPVGLRVEHGGRAVLLTGDSEGPARAYWMRVCPGLLSGCDVLKLAHHGSRNGTDGSWLGLGLVRPRLAVASLGRDNPYGHPHAEVLAQLDRAGVPLLRTDRDGSDELVSEGRGWRPVRSVAPARAPPAVAAPASGEPAPRRVDLNGASRAELEALPGIGPKLAERIEAGRPYRSVEDLGRVPGIGPKTLEELRRLVEVR